LNADIEVLSLRRIDRGSLKAVATVRLGPLIVASIRVLQQPGGDPWVALPQVPSRRRADGAGSGWAQIVTITSAAVLAALREAVLAAWESAP
jgi:hypothetical protein